jgi:hypothetical protein
MKKNYFNMFMLLTTGIVFGQVKQISDTKNYTLNSNQVYYVNGKHQIFVPNEKAGGDVVINETFSSMGSWTSSGTDGAVWQHDLNGPNGQYSNPTTQRITSTSVSDGFMIFDADLSNPAGTDFQNRVGSLVSPSYDLSATPNVMVYFEQSYRHCCSRDFVLTMDVSNNNFSTFTTYNVSVPGVAVNDQTGTVITLVNINDFIVNAGSMNNFQVRFNFDGSVGTTHYFWQIDDFRLIEQYTYDLSIANAWIGDIVTDFEVTEIPSFFNKELTFQAALRSFGSLTPSNIQITSKVFNSLNEEIYSNSGGTLANNFSMSYDTITFNSGLNTSILAPGTYRVELTISGSETDGTPLNNVFNRTLIITSNTLSSINFDGLVYRESISYNYRNTTTNVVPPMTVGSLFTLPATSPPVFLTGIDVALSTGPTTAASTVGEKILISIYEYDFDAATFAESFLPFSNEYEYTITADKLNTTGETFTFNFSASENGTTENVILESDKSYVASITHSGGESKYLWYWASAIDEDFSSYTNGPFGVGGVTSWFTLGYDPIMRMNLAQGVGLNELQADETTVSIYPNPANDLININFVLNQDEEAIIELIDFTGKNTLQKKNFVGKKGFNNQSLDASTFSSGIYFIKLTLNNKTVTKKVTIK